MAKAFVVAAPSSGSGKTLVTLALLRALRNGGYRVASAKLGPDYIDPGFHARATGTACHNLDLWAMGADQCRAELAALSAGHEIVVIEGVMGLFDGPEGATGSTADFAAVLNLPILLVVDCAHQAQSLAALVSGFTTFRADISVAGLILNRVKSDRHEALLRNSLHGGPPVVACLRHNDSLHMPSRHLGLVQAQEHQQLDDMIERAAAGVARETILDNLFRIGTEISNQPADAPDLLPPPGQHIAVARDEAFTFTYPHLLGNWRKSGAEITFFSPLNDEAPTPSADLVFLPGGYPELHAARIASASNFLGSLRNHAGLIYGECGGYMVLGQQLTTADGTHHAMAGLLPHATSFASRKLHLGYRQLRSLHGPFPTQMRGHEFHYSTELAGKAPPLFEAKNAAGDQLGPMGGHVGNVMGSYAHIIAAIPT